MAQTLKDSEIRYRRLFETAQDGILILNGETGEIEDVNPYLINMLGYSHEEFVQKKFWQMGAFKDIAASQEAFALLQANEYIHYGDLPLQTKDGHLVQVEFVSNVYFVGAEKVIQCNIRDITERKQAEKYAAASQERYRSTLNNMMEGCQIIDYDWRYIYVNDAAAKHGQKAPLDLLMHTMMDVYPGIEKTSLFRQLQISMNKRVRQRIENKFFYGDGKFGWFELSVQPVPEGIFVLSIDITERKQAEEMRAKLAAIVESSEDAIFGSWDGVITSWNLGAEQLYGYSAAEAIGQRTAFLVPPDRMGEFSEIVPRLTRGESVKNFETVRLRKDGSTVHVSLTISPMQDTPGEIYGASTIARDITERKQAEEIRANLATIVESSDDAIIGKTLDGVITSWNLGAERLYGYSAAEAIGQSISFLIPSDRPNELPEILTRLKRGESVKHFETIRNRKDGTRLEVSLTISPIKDAMGRVTGASTIGRDITQRKQAELQLAEAHTFLENILNYSPIGILTYKFTGECLSANEYAAHIVGATVADLQTQNFRELESWKNSEFYALAEKAIATRQQQSADIHVQTTFGNQLWLRAQFVVFQSNHEDCLLLTIGNITERKQAEEALRESERHYRQIIETTQEGVWTIDANNLTTLANQRLADMFGYTIEEMIGQPVDTFLDEEGKAVAPFALERRRQGVNVQLDFKFKRKDGGTVWALVETNTLQDVHGNYAGALAMLTDITSRKQMEDALRVNEERLTLALAATQTGVWEWNAQTNQVYWSPECYEIADMDPATEKTLDAFLTFIYPDDLGRVNASIEQALMQGTQFDVEFRIISQHGALLWVQDIGRAEYDSHGNPMRMIGTVSDISARKKSEELIRESDSRFRALLQNSSDAITLLDINGIVIYDSPAAPGMLGYTSEDWVGQDVFKLVHPDDLPETQVLFKNLAEKPGARLSSMFRVRHKNLFWVWVEVVATNLLAQPGVNAIVLNYRDITKRKQADERLRSAREFLQSVQDAISSHIAILDEAGTIVQVNAAWRAFGVQNGLIYADNCIGMNYLQICDTATGSDSDEAPLVARAIREVRSGATQEAWVEYPSHSPSEKRWFIARVTGFENNGRRWLAVTHTNITERKQAEIEIQQRLSELEVLYQSGLVFSHILSPKAIAKKVIDLLDQKMDWHHTAIRLYHPENDTVELLAFRFPHLTSSEERSIAKKRFKNIQQPDQGLSGWVLRHGKAVRCNDFTKDARYFATFPGLQSGLYVPIKIADRVMGVISIESEELNAFQKSDERLVVTLAAQVAVAIENAQLFERLKRSNQDLVSAYNATIEGWSRALDLRDKETEGHSLRVTEMTLKLSRALGLSEDELAQIRWGALLHDIGKMGIPDGILLKSGSLTDEEWVIMRKHPSFAYEMLLPIAYLRQALDIPYCHHEKWDGSGYPRGLKGDEIPLAARIFAVIDVWDALRSDRPYRMGWDVEKVREHIRFSAGTHFDPRIVDAFLTTFG